MRFLLVGTTTDSTWTHNTHKYCFSEEPQPLKLWKETRRSRLYRLSVGGSIASLSLRETVRNGAVLNINAYAQRVLMAYFSPADKKNGISYMHTYSYVTVIIITYKRTIAPSHKLLHTYLSSWPFWAPQQMSPSLVLCQSRLNLFTHQVG